MKRMAWGFVVAVILATATAALSAFSVDCSYLWWTLECWLF